jgi:hypothetical protein
MDWSAEAYQDVPVSRQVSSTETGVSILLMYRSEHGGVARFSNH